MHMEERIKSTEKKVCELQVTLSYMETPGGLVKVEVQGKVPLAYL